MTTTMQESAQNWSQTNGTRTETDLNLVRNEVKELVMATKVLCLRLDSFNGLMDKMTEHMKSKGENPPDGVMFTAMLGKLTVMRAEQVRKKVAAALGMGDEPFLGDEPKGGEE